MKDLAKHEPFLLRETKLNFKLLSPGGAVGLPTFADTFIELHFRMHKKID